MKRPSGSGARSAWRNALIALACACSLALARPAAAQSIWFTQKPPDPYGGSSYTVRADFFGQFGQIEHCDWAEACWWESWDYGVDQSTLHFTVNNANRTSSLTLNYDLQCTYWPGQWSCDQSGYASGAAPLDAGFANVLYVTMQKRDASGEVFDIYSYSAPPLSPAVVSAAAQYVERTGGQTGTARFTVTNVGEQSFTYMITAACTGMSCGSPSPGSLALGVGQSGTVDISYTAPASVGDRGLVEVTVAPALANPTAPEASWTEVTVVAAPSSGAVVARSGLGSTDVTDRAICVTFAAQGGTAVECGDLRASHALPVVRTMNKPRVPILAYNSDHAHPMAIIQADVTLPAGDALPNSVEAVLTINGTQITRSWNGSDWTPGETRRIAVQVDASTWTTLLYPYSLDIRRVTGGIPAPFATITGTLPVVNRGESPFGAGWWLAGLERIYFLGGNDIYWVGGDGSTRLYASAGANVWTATAVRRPDTLSYDGTHYYRHLPNKEKVKFDGNGLHVTSIDRLGHQTTLSHGIIAGRIVLSSVALPVVSGSSVYSFEYNGSGQLTAIDAPHPSGTGTRRTVITPDATTGRIAVIKDPSIDSVRFGYDGTIARRMISRTDREGFTTTFAYEGAKISASTLTLAGGAQISQSYIPAEIQGLEGTSRAVAQPLDSAFARLDGPRSDVGDVWTYWLTRFGAIRRLRDPLGREISIEYGNQSFPALATRMRDQVRFATEAAYNARGLVESVIARDPLGGGGGDAVTSHEWHATFDKPTRITSPLGVNVGADTRMSYDGMTGNLEWAQTGPDSTRTYFWYNENGLLAKAQLPGVNPDSLAYDPVLGNLSYTRGSNGAVTLTYTDAVGRDTTVVTPIDGMNTGRVRTIYNSADRVQKSVTSGPSLNGAAADSVLVEFEYDREGRTTEVRRHRGVHWPSSQPLVSTMQYDGAGRKLSESHPGRNDTFGYDPAGNLIQHQTPLGTITLSYDAANRLQRSIVPGIIHPARHCTTFLDAACQFSFAADTVPGDTLRYAYDAAGRLARAENIHARVRRTYTPSGLLAHDSLRIRTYLAGPTPWSVHSYALASKYDLDGRRVRLAHPAGIVGYEYDSSGRGLLVAVTDSGHTTTTLRYDAAGRVREVTHPGNVSELRTYSTDGFLKQRYVGLSIIGDTLAYDQRGLLTAAYTQFRNGQASNVTATMLYNGLGAVISADQYAGTGPSAEFFTVDALGERLRRSQIGADGKLPYHPDYLGVRLMSHDAHGRLWKVEDTLSNYDVQEKYTYNSAGDLVVQGFTEVGQNISLYDHTTSHPTVDGRIAGVQRHIGRWAGSEANVPGRVGVRQRYWYDALGRRIQANTHSDFCDQQTHGMLPCASYIERTVWDGDQILLERRVSWQKVDGQASAGGQYGEVVSVHGLGIDAPLVVRKTGGTSVAPHANWMGDFEMGTTANGTPTVNCNGMPDCPVLPWPGGRSTIDRQLTAHSQLNTWWGSLITHKTDPSGYRYMRNRYYNPQTGQFTQQDPIGLAGGLNLYGFAQGDPINFEDPFGLCTPWPDCTLQAAANWGAQRGGPLGTVVLNGAAAANAAAEALSINDLGRAVAAGDVGSGAFALASMLPVGRGASGLAKGIGKTIDRAQGAEVTFSRLGRFTRATWEVAGDKGAGYVKWNRVLDEEGNTIRLYKDVYDRGGSFLRRDWYVGHSAK
jgi:RHS repeat-associated protein